MTAEKLPSRLELMNEASLLMAKLDSGTISVEVIRAWRDADPRHAAALARINGFNHEVSELRAMMPPDFVPAAPNRRRLIASIVCAAAVGGAATSYGFLKATVKSASTRTGEKLSVALPDGSEMNVNTASKVEWKFSRDIREIWLKAGEIALTVLKTGGYVRLYAAGQFIEIPYGQVNARLRNDRLELSVLTGVATLGTQAAATIFEGQVLQAGASDRAVITKLESADAVTAWKDGELVLGGRTLAAAIDEYNRYLPYKLSIADPEIGSLKLGGRFKTNDPTSFLAALKSGFGVESTTARDGTIILSR